MVQSRSGGGALRKKAGQRHKQEQPQPQPQQRQHHQSKDDKDIDRDKTKGKRHAPPGLDFDLDGPGARIALARQQQILDVFKTSLLSGAGALDVRGLVQTIKTHLYNRDFDAAFTGASDDLLRVYALRWSASRALGYAGIFRAVMAGTATSTAAAAAAAAAAADSDAGANAAAARKHVVCIGGGAGAEIVALAATWADLGAGLSSSSANCQNSDRPALAVTAVDIADWSAVVERLAATVWSSVAPGFASASVAAARAGFDVRFVRADVLAASTGLLDSIFCLTGSETWAHQHGEGCGQRQQQQHVSTMLVTLMFTLNELFSSSLSRTTAFLLRMTDLLEPGTVLLVLDSPGSYSTLTLGTRGSASSDGAADSYRTDSPRVSQQERRYPMKFLLDHTLLSVAAGKWEKIFAQDSRWWRRDVHGLLYDVGDGVGLEDMRFQIHIYRRL